MNPHEQMCTEHRQAECNCSQVHRKLIADMKAYLPLLTCPFSARKCQDLEVYGPFLFLIWEGMRGHAYQPISLI